MASGPIQQAALPCEVCDGTDDVDWFCDFCIQNMCETCKTLHLRFKGSKDHKILPIFEGLRKVKFIEDLTCSRHGKQQGSYCKTCSCLICETCVTDNHNSHNICDCEAISVEKAKSVRELLERFKSTTIQDMKSSLVIIEHADQKFVDDSEDLKTLVAISAESVKSALCLKVDHILDIYTQKVQDNVKSNLDALGNQRIKIRSDLESFEHKLDLFQKQISYNTGAAIVKLAEKIEQDLSSVKSPNPLEGTVNLKFTEGELSIENVQKCFGELVPTDHRVVIGQALSSKRDLTDSSCKMKVTELSSFKPFYEDPSDLCAVDRDQAWVALRNASLSKFCVQKISRSGDVLTTIDLGFNPFMMKVMKTGELLVSNHSARIRKISKDFSISIWRKMEQNVFGIYITENNDLLLSLFNDDTKKNGKVVRETMDGKRLQEIQYDEKGQSVYKWPKRLIENLNGDIWTLDYNHRAVVVDSSGKHLFTYTGQVSKFDAHYIAHDSMGHVLITDFSNHRVHLLSKTGSFIQYILTKEDNVLWTSGIGVYEDHIWVAGSRIFVGKYLKA